MPAVDPVPVPDDMGVAVATITSTRTIENDPAGDAIVERLEAAGLTVPIRELINDDFDSIQRVLSRFVKRDDVYAVVVNGGLGLHGRDVTEESVRQLLKKTLPGIGESLRRRIASEDPSLGVVDRSFAGLRRDVVICCFPADPQVVEIAMDDILVPELEYLVGLARYRADEDAESG